MILSTTLSAKWFLHEKRKEMTEEFVQDSKKGYTLSIIQATDGRTVKPIEIDWILSRLIRVFCRGRTHKGPYSHVP
jgi:hypothetical protein